MTISRDSGLADGPAIIDLLPFAACYVYSPSGRCAASERSRRLCALLKAGNPRYIEFCAANVRCTAGDRGAFGDFFDGAGVLVPVPGSAPTKQGEPSVAMDLAAALVREGLGAGIWPGLARRTAVRKSSTAAAGARPSVAQHYESLALAPIAHAADQYLLIDDIVTRGRTLLAAASRLREACPRAGIRAFALLRTMGYVPDLQRLLDPCVGEIRFKCGEAHRNP